MKILRFNELKEIMKISRSSLERWEKSQGFPKRIKLGENSIGWDKEEVEEWIKNRKMNEEIK